MTLDPLKLYCTKVPTVLCCMKGTVLSLSPVHLHSCKPCTPRGGATFGTLLVPTQVHTATVDHNNVDPCPFDADYTRTNRRYERCAVRGPEIRNGPAHPLCNLHQCMPTCKNLLENRFQLAGMRILRVFLPLTRPPMPSLSSDPTVPQPTTHCPSLPPLLTTTIFSWQIFRSPLFSRRFPSLDLTSKTAAR